MSVQPYLDLQAVEVWRGSAAVVKPGSWLRLFG
jgi:hypothetical protein